MGASGHRRHRARLAAERHQQELGLGLGRAAAQPAGRGPLRAMTEVLFYHLQRQPLEHVLPAAAGEIARARLAGRGAGRLRGARRRAGRASVDLSRRQLPAAWHRPRRRRGGAADPADHRRPQSERRDGALPDRRRADAGGCRGYDRIVLLFDGEDDDAVAAARDALGQAKARASRSPTGSPTSRAAGSRRPEASGALTLRPPTW